jgi:hypothetical protein
MYIKNSSIPRRCFLALLTLLLSTSTILSEGMGNFGDLGDAGKLKQYLKFSSTVFVHTATPNQLIRLHLSDEDDQNNKVEAEIYTTTPSATGTYVLGSLLTTLTSSQGNISETHNMEDSLPASPLLGEKMEYVAATPGIYAIKFIKQNGLERPIYSRWDISVVDNIDDDVDPAKESGNVFSYNWEIYTKSFLEDASATCQLYTLVPGGYSGTNYVWTLDLQSFSGNEYQIMANDIGLDAPYSGYSQAETATPPPALSPKFPVYLSYPHGANPDREPVAPDDLPDISDEFVFVSNNAANDIISPDGDNIQDAGQFEFTPTATGTYTITFDIDKDGVYGNAEDRILLGSMTTGVKVMVPWAGENELGNTVNNGTYSVQLSLRLGEYHFVTYDTETSGGEGTASGLTIYKSPTDSTIVGTKVYWEDKSYMGGTSVMPEGKLSVVGAVTGDFRHSWGDWTSGGFGDKSYLDTYVYGLSHIPSVESVTVVEDIDNKGEQHRPFVEIEVPDQNLMINFASYTIDLKTHFEDVETDDATLLYTFSGNSLVNISITGGVATISSNPHIIGAEPILFTVTDETGLTATDTAIFTITSQTPTVSSDTIPDQNLFVNFANYNIDLKLYFEDVETLDENLLFTVTGNTLVEISINSGVASISHKLDIVGTEPITFIAQDESGLTVSDIAIFTITSNPPTVSVDTIPDQILWVNFADYTIDLKAYFEDLETADENLLFSVVGNTIVDIVITAGVATISSKLDIIGSEPIIFTATDEAGLTVQDSVNFRVMPIDGSKQEVFDFDLGHIENPDVFDVLISPNPSPATSTTHIVFRKAKEVDRIEVKIFSQVGDILVSDNAQIESETTAKYSWRAEEKRAVAPGTTYLLYTSFYSGEKLVTVSKKLVGIKK